MNVVVTAWRVPDKRIADFVNWNRSAFRDTGTNCLIVTDRELDLPDGFEYAIYPKPMEIFNLSACSNFGLKQIADGVICKTDIDCFFTRPLLEAMRTPVVGLAIAPIYIMALDITGRQGRPWGASIGTIALHWWDWKRVGGYNEKMQGYGVEDGDFYCRAVDLGVQIDRGHTIIHVAHDPSVPFNAVSPRHRADCWGRATGVNPRNHKANRRHWLQGDQTDFLAENI